MDIGMSHGQPVRVEIFVGSASEVGQPNFRPTSRLVPNPMRVTKESIVRLLVQQAKTVTVCQLAPEST